SGTTPTAKGKGDPCVPVSTSSIVPRTGGVEAYIAAKTAIPGTPANGTVNVSRNSAGKPTRIDFNADGVTNDYVIDISYDSAGRVTHWTYNANGANADASVDVSYDSSGNVSNLTSNGARASGATVKKCN